MNILKVNVLFIFCLLLFGCTQKIPTYDTGKGLVAFPHNFINSSPTDSLFTYEFISSKDSRFSVKIIFENYGKGISLSDPIDEGEYTVDTIIMKPIIRNKVMPTDKKEHKIELPFVIEVNDGEIGLIPYVFQIEQYKDMDQILLRNNIIKFDDELEKFYYERLKNGENIDQWKIRTL